MRAGRSGSTRMRVWCAEASDGGSSGSASQRERNQDEWFLSFRGRRSEPRGEGAREPFCSESLGRIYRHLPDLRWALVRWVSRSARQFGAAEEEKQSPGAPGPRRWSR